MRKNRYKIDSSILKTISVFNKYEDSFYKMNILLNDYFLLENGEKIFFEIMDIVYEDIHSDKTVYLKKPYQFVTDKQIEKGFNYCPVGNISIINFIEKYDFFFIQLREVFRKEEDFNILKNYLKENFQKLKFNYTKGLK